MQTNLDKKTRESGKASVVESILRKCVHCGFCNATCPTYQLLGDELDGPRGRIYQMKQYFEGEAANVDMLKHLDRCLTCRSCETTCPSGVHYSRLLEIGRHAIEQDLPRPLVDRMRRWLILRYINSGWLFSFSLDCARLFSALLPRKIRESIPAKQPELDRLQASQTRRVLALSGCVQSTLTPNTNIALNNLLQRMGIEVIEIPGNYCCGAAATHTSYPELGKAQACRLIDAWWSQIESGVEAILVSASGCGLTVRDYEELLADDSGYAEKAKSVSALFCDPVDFIEKNIEKIETRESKLSRVAVHTPCSMQHGLGINRRVESMLARVGYQLCAVSEAHLCCGSAGTYSMLQPRLSARLRRNKQKALCIDAPEMIASANVGCQLQIARGLDIPVQHWIELLDRALA